MNTNRYVAIVVLSLAAFSTQAREPVNKIVVSCPLSRIPIMRDVADVARTINVEHTFNARHGMIEQARHACSHGAVAVNIVPGTDPDSLVVLPVFSVPVDNLSAR